jgi:hypothetical protein
MNVQSQPQVPQQTGQETPEVAAQQAPDQLQRLVAPIALYPDELVAQILAAATHPDQVAQAYQWVQDHPELKGEQLGQEANAQPWDNSVKALTAFPSVLANMDKNLSWTSSLGDAYTNQEPDVMKAVQTLRQRAQQAGNLETTSQQRVTKQGKTIVIQPADPQVVYLPEYDPWLVYGASFAPWPGWYGYPGVFYEGPGIRFGTGFGIGFFGGFGWGFDHWGADWRHDRILFDHDRFRSGGRAFVNRRDFGRRNGAFNRGGGFHERGAFRGDNHRGNPSAFGGHHMGGVSRGFSGRGMSSFHGGGGHGGGGHGGGGHGGGHR